MKHAVYKPGCLSIESWGILLLLMSAALFSGMGCFVKLAASTGLPTTELVFMRALFQGTFIVAAMFCWRDEVPQNAEARFSNGKGDLLIRQPFGNASVRGFVIVRGLVGGMGFVFFYYTISVLPLGDASAILALNPILTVLVAPFFLGETIKILNLVAAASSFVGALLIARPEFLFGHHNDSSLHDGDKSLGYLTAILGVFCGSSVLLLIRRAGKLGAHTLNLIFSWVVFGISLSLIFGMLVGAEWHLPTSSKSWGYVLGVCVVGSTAHVLFNYAGRIVPAGIGSITKASNVFWSYSFQVLIFHEVPKLETVVGVALIAFSLVAVAIQKIRDETPESKGAGVVEAEKLIEKTRGNDSPVYVPATYGTTGMMEKV